jgi:hypothetical protein
MKEKKNERMRGIMKNIEKWRLGNCKTAFAYF